MPADEIIPLSYQKPRSGESICQWVQTPETLLVKLVAHLMVQGEQLNNKNYFVRSATQPGQDDQDKLWLKTSSPFGIGYFAGGAWQLLQTIPSGVIYIIPSSEDIPLGFTEVTEQQRTQIGLAELQGGRYIISR